jgi:hypothetical protein
LFNSTFGKTNATMKKCTYCGKEYANDKTACDIDGQPLLSTEPSGMAPPPVLVPATEEFTDYTQLPWHRKSGANSLLILASILTLGLFPGTLVVCVNVLRGEVYYNKKDERGYLKKWHRANKVVAVLLLALNIGRLVQLFTAMSR